MKKPTRARAKTKTPAWRKKLERTREGAIRGTYINKLAPQIRADVLRQPYGKIILRGGRFYLWTTGLALTPAFNPRKKYVLVMNSDSKGMVSRERISIFDASSSKLIATVGNYYGSIIKPGF